MVILLPDLVSTFQTKPSLTEMEMKKLHMGTMSFGSDTMDEVVHQLETAFGATHARQGSLSTGVQLATRGRRDISARVRDVVLSLALCHNVRSRLFFAAVMDKLFPGHSSYQ